MWCIVQGRVPCTRCTVNGADKGAMHTGVWCIVQGRVPCTRCTVNGADKGAMHTGVWCIVQGRVPCTRCTVNGAEHGAMRQVLAARCRAECHGHRCIVPSKVPCIQVHGTEQGAMHTGNLPGGDGRT